jgi:hypothetical protein
MDSPCLEEDASMWLHVLLINIVTKMEFAPMLILIAMESIKPQVAVSLVRQVIRSIQEESAALPKIIF